MIFRFGDARLDVERRQLLRDDREQPLQPKAFDLLRILIDARPKVLTKAEIMDLIWPDTYVAEANVSILITEIRAALADPAREPRCIKTHFAIGYSFIAEVTELTRSTSLSPLGPVFVLSISARKIVLLQGEMSVGRDPSSDILIPDPSVSRHHARFRVDTQQVWIEDLESKNGTRVDGARIERPTALHHGAELLFGSVRTTISLASTNDLSTVTIRDLPSEPPPGE
jgi:DNA-binding winged helix-turn-helix (wHTH) protein